MARIDKFTIDPVALKKAQEASKEEMDKMVKALRDEEAKARCTECGMPIKEPGQDVLDEDWLLCDSCYEKGDR